MDILDKLTSITKSTVDKTGDFIEINGLKNKITAEEDKIEDVKIKLGDYYWKKYNEGAELEEKAAKLCNEIKNSMSMIESYNKDIEKIKSAQVKNAPVIAACAACGAPIAEGVKFCSECGAKIE